MIVTELMAIRILQKAEEAKELYYRLVLVVSSPISGDGAMFKELAAKHGLRLVNVNRELSARLLNMTARQRSLKAASFLSDIVAIGDNELVLLEHIEILFDPALRLDPLRLLQSLSRRKTIIASWKGQVQGTYLTYAEPDHPEYRRYSTRELVLIQQE